MINNSNQGGNTMAQRREYKNAIRSRKRIQEAVFALIKENRGLKSVTISAVVKKAGVNRGTFYNHYKDIEDVIEDVENSLVRSFDETLYESDIKTIDELSVFFFTSLTEFLKKNEEGFKYIVAYIPINIFDDFHNKLLKSYRTYIMKKLDYTPREENNMIILTSEIISNGVAATYLSYFKGELNATLDDISNNAISLVKKISE